jgi:Transposase, Mutator family
MSETRKIVGYRRLAGADQERALARLRAVRSDLIDPVIAVHHGLAERLHPCRPREAVLAAWGKPSDGEKALLGLAPGTKEDTASCKEFLQDLRRRGLSDPLLLTSDGAPALIRKELT